MFVIKKLILSIAFKTNCVLLLHCRLGLEFQGKGVSLELLYTLVTGMCLMLKMALWNVLHMKMKVMD